MSPVTFDPRAFERKQRVSLAEVRVKLYRAATNARPWVVDGMDALFMIGFAIVGTGVLGLAAYAIGGHVQ